MADHLKTSPLRISVTTAHR